MALSREHLTIISITLMFVLCGGFLLLYVNLYNARKRRHIEEKARLRDAFDIELTRTRSEVQEHTMQTIASDIHDNIGQLLSLVRMTLSSVEVRDPDRTGAKVEQALQLTEDAIRDLRQLANVLHAHNLLARGLEHAVRQELARVRRTGQLQASVSNNGTPGILHPEQALIAFRLLQELLNNSIKHAQATTLSVHFEYYPDFLTVRVHDDGQGFDVAAARAQATGLGLGNLYRRAALIGGELNIQSTRGSGTEALLRIPYQKETSA
ncbi:MAG: sensor histidine kinase [Chitinophagaceae bacterium]|nr:MAG: sensor histidine kinase [Chitinophagaceae bacterium]